MRSSIGFLVVLTATWLLTARPGAAGAKKIVLDGEWTVESYIVDGMPVDKAEFKELKLVIKGQTFEVQGGKPSKGTFVTNTGKIPFNIDVITEGPDGKKIGKLGLLELKDGTMRVCLAAVGKDRPTEFDSKRGSGNLLIVYKRVK